MAKDRILKSVNSKNFDAENSTLPKDSFARPKAKRTSSYHGKGKDLNSRDNLPEKPSDYESRPKLSREESQRIFDVDKIVFEEIKPKLLKDAEYIGKWVAVVNGEMVDSGSDHMAVIMRVYSKYGNVPMYCDKITEEKQYVEFSSPE